MDVRSVGWLMEESHLPRNNAAKETQRDMHLILKQESLSSFAALAKARRLCGQETCRLGASLQP